MSLAKKPEPNLPKLLLKILKPISETWLDQRNRQPWKTDFAKWNRVPAKTLNKTLKPIVETWANLTRNYLSKNHEPILKQTKIWKITTAKETWLSWTWNFIENQNPNLKDSNANLKRDSVLQRTRKI